MQKPIPPKRSNRPLPKGRLPRPIRQIPSRSSNELNRLRATEVTSYLHYKQHASMAVSLFAPGLKNAFEAHALLELQHADLLAQRIQQLGGVPIYSPVAIAAQAASVGVRPEQGPTLREMIIENLMLERQQVAAYTTLVREIGERDPTTRRLLMEILRCKVPAASSRVAMLPRRGPDDGAE